MLENLMELAYNPYMRAYLQQEGECYVWVGGEQREFMHYRPVSGCILQGRTISQGGAIRLRQTYVKVRQTAVAL